MAETVTIIVNAKDNASKVLGGIKGMFSGIAQVAGGILAAGVIQDLGRAMVGFGVDSIKAASDLGETWNKVNTIFGERGTGQITDFVDEWGTQLGQSKQQMLDAASTFGVFGKSAGLSGVELADFSGDLVELSSDLASFYNTSPEDAITAIGAALRGESEPIRRYGVLLDDATLRQKALEMGIVSTTKDALTPQQKVLAANAVIMEQTADAQGDFVKTSDGLANSQRILAAQMANLKTQAGEAFLPIVTKLAAVAKDQLMPALSQFIDNVIVPAAPAVAALVDGFMNLLSGGLEMPAMLQPLVDAFGNLFASIQESGPMVMAALQIMWDFLVNTWASVGPVIIGHLTGIINSLAELWRNHGAEIMAIVTILWDTLVVTILGAVQLISGVISAFLSLLNGETSDALEILQGTWTNFMNSVLSLVGMNLEQFNTIWRTNFEMLKTIVTVGLRNAAIAIVSAVSSFVAAGNALVDGLKAGIKSRWDAMVAWFKEQIAKLPAAVKEILGISSPSRVFAEIGQNMMMGMGQGIQQSATIPANAAARAAGGVVNNSYNLTIHEAGQRGNVVSDFALLKSLAGA